MTINIGMYKNNIEQSIMNVNGIVLKYDMF